MADLINEQIKGYRILDRIGSGGFGEVYSAHQDIIERQVAIKVILPQHAQNPDFARRFDYEAQLIARLEHPYIVPLYDYWREPSRAILVMRYFQRGSLSRYLNINQHLTIEQSAVMLEQIASALGTAHQKNIVHRDIKPDNILLDDKDNAYLTDFGLAETLDNIEDSSQGGTPAYMAPEVIMSKNPGIQSDIYSLGFVVYEMLTGLHPFDLILGEKRQFRDLIRLQLQEPIPHINDISDELNMVLQRATAKDTTDRYESLLDFARDFRAFAPSNFMPSGDMLPMRQSDDDSNLLIITQFINNPYKGLQAFEEADADTFFGRESLVEQMITRLEEDTTHGNFLAVVGPSGIGKSSVVKAGLLPAIRNGKLHGSDQWFILNMIPSTDPISQLSATLSNAAIHDVPDKDDLLRQNPNALAELIPQLFRDDNSRILIFIDQFEEVFTMVEDEDVRRQFLSLILQGIQSERVYIVITMRADFYDRPLFYEQFGQLIEQRTQLVLPLSASELTRIIIQPAEQVGLELDPELVGMMIADVREESGALPLLQYALSEVFERREGNRLTAQAYQDIGGIAGALAHRADQLYYELDAEHQSLAQQMFLRMVTLGEGQDDTRRRAKHGELMSMTDERDQVQQILDKFGKYRLLTFDYDRDTREPTIEIAHEALIREWRNLRLWLDASRGDIRLQRTLASAVTDWQKAQNERSYLLRGSRLHQFDDWAKSSRMKLSDSELAFLRASRTVQEEEVAHEAELQKRASDRLRQLVVVLAIGFVLAVSLGAFGLEQGRVATNAQLTSDANAVEAINAQATSVANAQLAEENAQLAEASAQDALSLAIAVSARQEYNDGLNPILGLLLAIEAVNRVEEPNPTVLDTLIWAATSPGFVTIDDVEGDYTAEHLAISGDGAYRLYVGGAPPAQRIMDDISLPTNRPGIQENNIGGNPPPNQPPSQRPPSSPSQPSTDVDLEVDSEVMNQRRHIIVENHDERTIHHRFEQHEAPITSLVTNEAYAFSADSLGQVYMWDIATGILLHDYQVSAGFVELTVSYDGSRLLIASHDMQSSQVTHTIYDILRDRLLSEYIIENALLSRMDKTGEFLVSVYATGNVFTRDVLTGAILYEFSIPRIQIRPPSVDLDFTTDTFEDPFAVIVVGDDTLWQLNLITGESFEVLLPILNTTHRIKIFDDYLVAITSVDGNFILYDLLLQASELAFSLESQSNPLDIEWHPNNGHLHITTNQNNIVEYSTSTESTAIASYNEGTVVNHASFAQVGDELTVFTSSSQSEFPDFNGIWQSEAFEGIPLLQLTSGTFGRMGVPLWTSNDGQLLLYQFETDLMVYDIQNEIDLGCLLCGNYSDTTKIANDSRQDSTLFAVYHDGELDIYDSTRLINHIKPLHTLPNMPIDIVDFDFNGTHLVFLVNRLISDSDSNEQYYIWMDAETGAVLYESDTLEYPSNFIVFMPDEDMIALNYEEIGFLTMDVEDGEVENEFEGHSDTVMSVDFFDNLAVSGALDNQFIIWDWETGELLESAVTPDQIVNVVFSPDGDHFLTVHLESSPILWRTRSWTQDQVFEWIEANRYVRNFTESECTLFEQLELCATDYAYYGDDDDEGDDDDDD